MIYCTIYHVAQVFEDEKGEREKAKLEDDLISENFTDDAMWRLVGV
jgi:hypothetical protein